MNVFKMLMINSLSQYFGHKYKANLGKNKQKIPKSYFFSKKKVRIAAFLCQKTDIFRNFAAQRYVWYCKCPMCQLIN